MTSLNFNSNKCLKNINFLFLLVSFLFTMAAQAIDHADNNQLKTIANSNSTHYKVFILSGQSNAVGMAPSSDFPTDYQTEPVSYTHLTLPTNREV